MCILSFDYTARQLELGGESADAAPFCQHRELTENKLFQHRELTEDGTVVRTVVPFQSAHGVDTMVPLQP